MLINSSRCETKHKKQLLYRIISPLAGGSLNYLSLADVRKHQNLQTFIASYINPIIRL